MQFGKTIVVTVAALAAIGFANEAKAQEYVVSGPQLFANQYSQGMSNQATAQMYVSPVPVPQWVGHTYYTYQPFYPHQMLYPHYDRYHSYYDGGKGLNRTKVHYSTAPLRSMGASLFKKFSLPRP